MITLINDAVDNNTIMMMKSKIMIIIVDANNRHTNYHQKC